MNKLKIEKDCVKCWNKNASYWSNELNKGNDIARDAFMLPAFLENLSNVNEKNVLDVGCGDGSISRILSKLGANVTGLDFSINMINLAKQLSKFYNINYAVGSAINLSKIFVNSRFDVIVSFMVVHSISDIRAFFHQAYSILSSGGELYFLTAHPCFRQKKSEYISGQGVVITNYFNTEIEHVKWDFGKIEKENMEDIRFPWKLEDYINCIADAGFVIKQALEPKPTKSAIEKLPYLEKWTHAAHSLIVKASKR